MRPRFNLANALTWFRIAAIPLVVLVFYAPVSWSGPATCLVFTLAGLTDWLDGYVARRLNLTSPFGAFLDPVADKLMVATALVVILQADPSISLALVAAIIIGREITISALREWMAEQGARSQVAVSSMAKVKTTMQMVGLGAMLFGQPFMGIPIYEIGFVLLLVAAALTLISMINYLRAARPSLVEGQRLS